MRDSTIFVRVPAKSRVLPSGDVVEEERHFFLNFHLE